MRNEMIQVDTVLGLAHEMVFSAFFSGQWVGSALSFGLEESPTMEHVPGDITVARSPICQTSLSLQSHLLMVLCRFEYG